MKTKIILEIGYNHNGNLELAKKMIEKAASLKVWGVKFQKWTVDEFPKWLKRQERSLDNSYGLTYYDHRKFLEFDIEKHYILKRFSEELGLKYICSGKDFTAVKELIDDLKINYIKLPSQRLTDFDIYEFLKYKNVFKMVSTGMSYEKEIINNKWLNTADVIFHCISLYPAPLNDCNFGFMKNNRFYNGYSSHEIEGKAIKYSVMLGAEYIERHFTIDRNMKGTDHKISSDIDEMKRIIEEIKEAETIYGNDQRVLSANEEKIRSFYKEF